MSKLNVEGSRNSVGLGRPPPSPGAKRNSGLDPDEINSMFPDAAAAIAKQKADFTQHTGTAPTSNRNSASMEDRFSLVAPTISAPHEDGRKENTVLSSSSPWVRSNIDHQQPSARPKSSSGQQPMGHFSQPALPPAGFRSPRAIPLSSNGTLQNTTHSGLDGAAGMPILSPYTGSGNWASMVNTPMVSNFSTQQSANQADMVQNATAMKLAALSTVNNRIQLDDVRKYRRARSSDGQRGAMQQQLSPGLQGTNLSANFIMTNEFGQVLTPQQAAALQAQQLTAISDRRSRPNSPGLMIPGGGLGGMSYGAPQTNGFLAAYGNGMSNLNNGMNSMNMAQYGVSMGGGENYLTDAAEFARGRSPRGRRGTSKPPEDPTDIQLLQDIPNWLRSLRLHKYNDNLKDMRWEDLVQLDDEGLERKGVNALGARRKLLKVWSARSFGNVFELTTNRYSKIFVRPKPKESSEGLPPQAICQATLFLSCEFLLWIKEITRSDD